MREMGQTKIKEYSVSEILQYSDDTAMTRSVVQSLLTKPEFDEADMAQRFAYEFSKEPDRGYGMGAACVLKKLLSPKCTDVYQPAREQFDGKGSYGNGGAMRVSPIALAYSDIVKVKKFARRSAELTHASSLGYNGAILQALAVHFALQGELERDKFLDMLITEMKQVEGDEKSLADARELKEEDYPFSCRLKKIKELLGKREISRDDIVNKLGNGIAALESVPTAIYSFLHCMELDPEIPEQYNNFERTILYSISLGGDTDTIATMAGAIAGAYYGIDQIPQTWIQNCEASQEIEQQADKIYELLKKQDSSASI
ncbi:ADP-ribose glycohydrolase ARH3 isoform X2 [Protopterus annectens]|uniref:ADP-ribose glycohydrolase ARH3 isoform X2 n=1 Tax=Protopterus annectens TaxID=7888 RepID=UPI001CFBB1C6|nr:ADP-ribose glycohydrolase ARH3 isoform X2 [Protopterus annectens]